ncbi:MAG: EAL domain-containing protein [Burkholderiales bacterium]|nr:EAL domain-containing protein [Burkholderiales bacterium]
MRTPVLAVLVALAYVATGWLSLHITIPPYYVSLLFIPAGVALGAVLVWGVRVLPGVLVGAFAVNWLASVQAGLPGVSWALLVSPLGAALQTFATAWLARHWAGYTSELDAPRPIMLLLLVCVPLGHLVNASMSVPLLVWGGVVPVADAMFTWWTWWHGDAMGAVLFTPLMLVAFARPAAVWRPRLCTVALPMVVALAVVSVAFIQIQSADSRALSQRFDRESEALTERLQRRLHAQTDGVMAVARLKEINPHDDLRDYVRATSLWLDRYAGTQNFGWSPLVRDADRAAFEQRANQLHGSTLRQPYVIRGRDGDGRLFTASQADTYLPILLVEPLSTNQGVLGLDVQVLPATASAVRATMQSGLAHVTEGIRLVQETGEQRGVVMYQAVFQSGSGTTTADRVRGVVSAVFRMDDVVHAALGELDADYLMVCLLDPAAPAHNQRLTGHAGCSSELASKVRYFSSSSVQFGERTWLFQVAAGPRFESHERGWIAWSTLTVSLLAVTMLGVFLIVQTGHARRTEQLVAQRTRELAHSNAGLQKLAMYDPLTGLANRLHWTAEVRKALDASRRHGDKMAVLFVDLDHFKNVNDSLGHSVGDLLLKAVAERLQACLRAHDVMARQGGDEFVVMMSRLRHKGDAALVASKMVGRLTEPFSLDGHTVRASASVGVVLYEGGDEDVETLLRHADLAMYRAKASGRNAWAFFEPEMDHSIAQRLLVESDLRHAIADNELVLHYQPQVNCLTGVVTGVEALVRWQHPQRGLLMPDSFVPQAEASGLIDSLGSWVMREAFRQWRAWADQGIDGVSMAVNVSAMEFGRATFISRLRQALDDTGADPDWIELEITESALMESLPELIERLGDIARMGVRLALDDFGTGYSSLGYLKRLPLNSLKIDKSFVRELPGDKEDEAIVCATLSMAKALSLKVVAEGVEVAEQRAFLADLGCDEIQGWLVARPMPAAVFEAWWHKRQARSA